MSFNNFNFFTLCFSFVLDFTTQYIRHSRISQVIFYFLYKFVAVINSGQAFSQRYKLIGKLGELIT